MPFGYSFPVALIGHHDHRRDRLRRLLRPGRRSRVVPAGPPPRRAAVPLRARRRRQLDAGRDTREFGARLREASSNQVLYAELPGAQHGFGLWFSLRYSYVIEAVAAFCEAERR